MLQKTIALNSKLDLEDRIIRHYENETEIYSLEKIFPEYCIDRQKYVKQTTIVRDKSIFKSFLAGTPISKKSLEDPDGRITKCKTFEEVIEYKMPNFDKINKLNEPIIFRRAI